MQSFTPFTVPRNSERAEVLGVPLASLSLNALAEGATAASLGADALDKKKPAGLAALTRLQLVQCVAWWRLRAVRAYAVEPTSDRHAKAAGLG
jgi:hypothetical protein